MDVDRGSKGGGGGWTEERAKRTRQRDGEGEGRNGVSRRAREDRRKPGTSRFCYDQWRTGTQRAPFVSIRGKEGESERGTLHYVGLSVECLSLPGSPHPSSARILRLPRFSESGRLAGLRRIFLLFVRFIARSLSFSFLQLFLSLSIIPFRLCAFAVVFSCVLNAMLICFRDIYLSQNSMMGDESRESETFTAYIYSRHL